MQDKLLDADDPIDVSDQRKRKALYLSETFLNKVQGLWEYHDLFCLEMWTVKVPGPRLGFQL